MIFSSISHTVIGGFFAAATRKFLSSSQIQFNLIFNKKLSCRREVARCFVSLNVLQSHSRSFEMTPLSMACVSPYYFSIVAMSIYRITSHGNKLMAKYGKIRLMPRSNSTLFTTSDGRTVYSTR